MTDLAQQPIGIYEKALPPDGWPEILDNAGTAGFAFVEMSVDESPQRLDRLDWSKQERARVRHAVEDTGVPIYSICLSAHRRFGLGSGDSAIRAEADRILDAAIGLAADIGVRVVQIAGYFSFYEVPDSCTRQRYVNGLRRGVQRAAERGVMLGVENIDTADMASAQDALDLVREMSSPWFRIYPDVGNFAVHRLDVVDNVTAVLPQAIGMHLKDARVGEPRRVAYGAGEVPFRAVFDRLHDLSYHGPFTLEMWNDDPDTAMTTACRALEWIRSRLGRAGENTEQTT